MKLFTSLALVALMSMPSVAVAQKSGDVMSAKTFDGMKVRNIGPAYMSGRISDIEVDPNDVGTWYVAVASGGVWKTVNAGTTWTPIFDEQSVYSIGDVTLDPSNSDIVWVGTGENNGGRHIGFGDGVYKSMDGGKTWKNMGLPNSEHVGDIIVHPEDGNTVWVSSQGPLWSKGGQRGVYKTTDGGETWRNVTPDITNEWTGVGSLAVDPTNPDKLYAFTWQRQRTVNAVMDGGPDSALYTSDDGGENWRKLTTGLPKGQNWGKSSVAVSPMKPNVVYAAIELQERTGAFARSEDYGESWTILSDMVGAGTGAHYYQEIFADPHTFDQVYFTNNSTSVSMDGGKTWEFQNRRNRHGDDHAFAFHHSDPDFILVGTDGGVYESRDDMKNWRFMANMSLTQFYKIAADDAEPFYNVYGGTQDNSTQGGPSRTDRADGIKNSDWYLVNQADGHQPATEPGNPNIVYAQSQKGGLVRYDHATKERVSIQPQPRAGEGPERFNWDAPINVSTHDSARLYHASHRVWRSDDRGDSWTPISGDLTRNGNRYQMDIMDRKWGPESTFDWYAMSDFFTIANFSESPLDENLLYAGTDDGLIQVTTDGGQNWTRYEVGKIKGVPANAYVNDIRADLHDKDTVYATLDNHKEGDYKPYIIKSTNRGKSWKMITNGLGDKNLVWRIAQDHVNKNLMFIGTEWGIYFTVDGGSQWVKLTGDMPTISIRDVRIQARENDLVAGSFGRGIYILDDYTPLRGLNADSMKAEALLFPSRTALSYVPDSLHARSQGEDQWIAPNPAFGATFTYYLKDKYTTAKQKRVKADKASYAKGDDVLHPDHEQLETEAREEMPTVTLTVKDGSGNVVKSVKAKNASGVNRVTWDLRYNDQSNVTGRAASGWRRGPSGAMATPGTYTATLSVREDGVTRQLAGPVSFDVEKLRTSSLSSSSSRSEVLAFAQKVEGGSTAVGAANETVQALKKRLKLLRTAMGRATSPSASLEASYKAIRSEVLALDEALNGKAVVEFLATADPTIRSRLGFASGGSRSTYGPTEQHEEQFGIAMAEFGDVNTRLNRLVNSTVPAFEKALIAAGAPWSVGSDLP
jgi:photosystem II stability/assembly factor-like uncharacterized protein